VVSPPSIAPADCALLLAVPLTESAFFDNLVSPLKDYAAHIARSTPGATKAFLWERYSEIAEFAGRIAKEVAAQGVFVKWDATLDDFSKAMSRFSAVTLLAHSRELNLAPDDICNPRALLSKLKHLESFTARQLRLELAANFTNLQEDRRFDDETLRVALAGFFGRLISRARDIEPFRSDPTVFHIKRAEIEDLFPDEIVPGACVEFADGLKPARALILAIPENYHGILDLSMCHSAFLGGLIKQYRRRCTVIRNKSPATPFFKLVRYKLVIGQLQRRPAPYVDAISRVQTAMLKHRTV
jgi:hypothetical protein